MVKAVLLNICALLLLLAAAVPAAAAPVPEPQVLEFEVRRDGTPIGHHRVTITRDGDETRVAIDIDFRVTMAGVLTLYRYTHSSEEVWRGDRLVRLRSTTDNDGKAEYLNAVAEGDALRVDGSGYQGLLPAQTMPTSYWRSDFVERRPIMDSQDGHVLDVSIRPARYETASLGNAPVPARRYHVTGEFDWYLWYDAEGNWVKSAFRAMDGSSIDYRRK